MPASCDHVKDWVNKEKSEEQTLKWLSENTKTCPECGKHIEKNGGCMHMTCQRFAGGCGAEFCWLCRKPWRNHNSSDCNKFVSTNKEVAKTDLQKYIFYYHRYLSHLRSLKVVDKHRTEGEKLKEDCVIRFNCSYIETSFVSAAVERIIRNRKTLLWSYVHSFYIDNGEEKTLLEYLQQDLERYNEMLSACYERKISKVGNTYLDFVEWKNEMASLIKMTETFHDKFVQGAMSGLMNVNS